MKTALVAGTGHRNWVNGPTAPAAGLFLLRVTYPDELTLPPDDARGFFE